MDSSATTCQAVPCLWRHRHEFCWGPHTRVFGESWFSLRTHTGEFASRRNGWALCIYSVFRMFECIIVKNAKEELFIFSKPFYRERKSSRSLRSVGTLVQSPCWWRDPTNTPSHRSKMPSGMVYGQSRTPLKMVRAEATSEW